MERILACAVSALLITGCSDREVEPHDIVAHERVLPQAVAPQFCGGEAKPGEIGTYFSRLADHLATDADPVPMAFYAETFSVHSRDRSLAFRRHTMGAGARALPTLEDWREISRRGSKDLASAGYRGCFLAHGKVWFEADGRGGFAMSSFNKAMPWDGSTP